VNFEPIGTIESPVRDAVDENWGSIESEIHLEGSCASGLQGIDGFSHIIVVFFMHQSTFDPVSDLLRRPQGRPDMPQIGIFAQRAKHRPNPIGITAVRLIGVEGNVLKVKGLDAIDGTPVLDIKPYFPAYDRVQGAVIPEWVERLMGGYF
jgi:tRNA-Thr(GGU) m(6)t(6)A37 methyltransferase TsaA